MKIELYWEDGAEWYEAKERYFDDNDNEITEAEYKQLIELEEQKKVEEEERRSFQIEIMQIGNEIRKLNTETFHTLLIKYKETKDEYYYNAISINLDIMTKRLADKYIKKKLPLRCKQMFLEGGDCNSDDYSEYLTETLINAIETWQPNMPSKDGNTLVVKFGTYYEVLAKNWAANILEKYNSKYAQKITGIISLDNAFTDKVLDEISKHCSYDEQDKIIFDVYLKEFIKELRKLDGDLPIIFALLNAEYSYQSIADILGCSTKTIQRKKKLVAEQWLSTAENMTKP